MKLELHGITEAVFINLPDSTLEVPEVQVAWSGLLGDRYNGITTRLKYKSNGHPKGSEVRNTRQASLVSVEDLQEIASLLSLPAFPVVALCPNLLTRGIPALSFLPAGTRLFFESGAVLCVEGYNPPCMTAGRNVQAVFPDRADLGKAFVKAAQRKRGLVAWVEKEGNIRTGDSILVRLPDGIPYPHSEPAG